MRIQSVTERVPQAGGGQQRMRFPSGTPRTQAEQNAMPQLRGLPVAEILRFVADQLVFESGGFEERHLRQLAAAALGRGQKYRRRRRIHARQIDDSYPQLL